MVTKVKQQARRPSRQALETYTYSEWFLVKLEELSDNGQRLVPDRKLRQALEWMEGPYNRIKEQLIAQGAIHASLGPTGTVALARPRGAPALSIFLSYSHKDEAFKDDISKHLTPLQRLGLVEDWHDRRIEPGKEWGLEISKQLDKANIILLLVSIDFISSKYCYGVELERALERHAQGQAVVIPIIVRSCMWQTSPFAKLQALPKDAKAISTWSDRDEALTSIAEAIKQTAESILARR